jgi:hypothetical protein
MESSAAKGLPGACRTQPCWPSVSLSRDGLICLRRDACRQCFSRGRFTPELKQMVKSAEPGSNPLLSIWIVRETVYYRSSHLVFRN